MKKLSKLIIIAPIFFLCAQAEAFDIQQIKSKSIVISKENIRNIERGDIEIYLPVEGITTAQDTYDILAPFEGRIEEVMAELFDLVDEKEILAKIVSAEMAAMLDASTGKTKIQMKRRWRDIFKLYDTKAETRGIITKIYVKSKDIVNKGDRLFTIAKKVVIVGKNTKPVYCPLKKNLTADMKYAKDPSFKLKSILTKFMPLQPNSFYYRLWLDTGKLKNKTKIGERFKGYLFVGRTEDARIVPTNALINIQNKKYLMIEIKTGLTTPESTEILRPGDQYIIPKAF